jgi:hypothetical protein
MWLRDLDLRCGTTQGRNHIWRVTPLIMARNQAFHNQNNWSFNSTTTQGRNHIWRVTPLIMARKDVFGAGSENRYQLCDKKSIIYGIG